MTRNEFTANLQLAGSAQSARVGAHLAKRAPVGRYAQAALSDWRRVSVAVMVAAPALAPIIIRFA